MGDTAERAFDFLEAFDHGNVIDIVDPFDAWLDARDGKSIADAWAALAPQTIEVGPAPTSGLGVLAWTRTGSAAAQLASAWLGVPIAKVAWLGAYDNVSGDLERAGAPPSIVREGGTGDLKFLENVVDERDCFADWDIREVIEGTRGVQRVKLAWGRSDGTRDGGEGGFGIVVRFFDRVRKVGASVALYSCKVSLIGGLDLETIRAPLDLFDLHPSFRVPAWKKFDPEQARALVAQLAAEIDAHYDQSAAWPIEELQVEGPDRWFVRSRCAHGPHAVLFEERKRDGTIDIHLEGLPWGQEFQGGMRFTPEAAFGYFNVRLPEEIATRMLARLKSIDGVVMND